MAKTHNIFISHSWAYSDSYEKLLGLLNQDSEFLYKNYSVPKNDPIHNAPYDCQLYEAIKNKISPCSVVIVLAGVYSSYSKWIDKEINICKNEFIYPKKIIAVEPWGSERTSTKVKDSADEIVKWQSSSIISAIKKLS